MTNINNYSVGLTLDAASYIRNSSLSRKETAALTRSINAARTPAEKYERQVNQLDKALKEGAIDQATYNRLLDDAARKFKKAEAAAKGMDRTAGVHNNTIKTLVASYLGFETVKRVIAGVHEEMEAISKIKVESLAIGEDINTLNEFKFAAGRIAKVEGPEAVTMLQKLTQRVGEASLEIGEAGENFERLGLDINRLKRLSPVEQFNAVRGAIASIKNPTEQVAMATKFFEESGAKLLPLLRASNEEYGQITAKVRQLGLSIDESIIQKSDSVTNSFDDMGDAAAGMWRSLSNFGPTEDAIQGTSDSFKWLGISIKTTTVAVDALIDKIAGIDRGKLAEFKEISKTGFNVAIGKPDDGPKNLGLLQESQRADPDANVKREPGAFNVPTFEQKEGSSGKEFEQLSSAFTSTMGDWSKSFLTTFDAAVSGINTQGENLDGMKSAIQDAMQSPGHMAMSAVGLIANAVNNFGTTSAKAIVESTKNVGRELAPSLEVGTQEAYEYLAKQQNQELQKKDEKEKLQEEANKIAQETGDETNRLLGEVVKAVEDNKPKRLR